MHAGGKAPRVLFSISKIWAFVYHPFIPCFCKQVKALLKLYAKEKYILVVNRQRSDFEVFVSFKVCINITGNDLEKIIVKVQSTWKLCKNAGRSYKYVRLTKFMASLLVT